MDLARHPGKVRLQVGALMGKAIAESTEPDVTCYDSS